MSAADPSPSKSTASAGRPDEPSQVVETEYFTGGVWPDRIEVVVTRSQLTDDDNLEEFGERLMEVVERSGAKQVLVDVSALRFVTSSTLSKFIGLQRTLRREGGQLVIAHPGETISEVLDATNLNTFFKVVDSVAEGRAVLDADEKA